MILPIEKTGNVRRFDLAGGCLAAARGENAILPAGVAARRFNFNPDWKFIREDVTNARRVDFDDSKWATVSAPHTYNDTDSYTEIISHSGGDRHAYTGIAWYRKHFKLPAGAKDGKVFLEFEGLKQAGRFWVNGRFVGKYENGVTPLRSGSHRLREFRRRGKRHRREGGQQQRLPGGGDRCRSSSGWAARSIPITAA